MKPKTKKKKKKKGRTKNWKTFESSIIGAKFFEQVSKCVTKFNHSLGRDGNLWARTSSSYRLRHLEAQNKHKQKDSGYCWLALTSSVASSFDMQMTRESDWPLGIAHENSPSSRDSNADCLLSSFPTWVSHPQGGCPDWVDLFVTQSKEGKTRNVNDCSL